MPLVRVAPRESVLLVVVHHIVSDGWSQGVLMRELASLYQSFSAGLPASLPELPLQYADYAAWQRAWLEGEVLETQLEYWRDRLAPQNIPRIEEVRLLAEANAAKELRVLAESLEKTRLVRGFGMEAFEWAAGAGKIRKQADLE